MSETQAISSIGPRRVGEDVPNAARRRPAGPLFLVLETWCCRESPLGANARHVLVQIAKRMQANGEGRQVAFMGEETLAQDTGLSQRTVRRAVKDLRDAGRSRQFRAVSHAAITISAMDSSCSPADFLPNGGVTLASPRGHTDLIMRSH